MRRPDRSRRARPPMPRLCVLGVYSVAAAAPLAAVLLAVGAGARADSAGVVAVLVPAYVVVMALLSVPILSCAMRRWPVLAADAAERGRDGTD